MLQSILSVLCKALLVIVTEFLRLLFAPLYAGLVLFGPSPGGHHSQMWFPLALVYTGIWLGVIIPVLVRARVTHEPLWIWTTFGMWVLSWLPGRFMEFSYSRQRATAQSQD